MALDLSNDQRSRLCRVEQDMAIYSCMRMCGESLTRMASKNHDQYFFANFAFGAMLSHLWASASHSEGLLELLHHACTYMHHAKWDNNHAPTINTADSPRRHQYVCQLIKLGLNTIVRSAYSMPNTTGMAATVTPERHRLGI